MNREKHQGKIVNCMLLEGSNEKMRNTMVVLQMCELQMFWYHFIFQYLTICETVRKKNALQFPLQFKLNYFG